MTRQIKNVRKKRHSLQKDHVDKVPASIPNVESQEDPHQEFRDAIERVLSENFMIFLTILMLLIVLVPLFFNFSMDVLKFLDTCDFIIVAIFIFEYGAKFFLAKNRWKFFKNGWHILDLIIIMVSLLGYVQILAFGEIVSGSPALLLRLLRIMRAFAFGGKTVTRKLRTQETAIADISEEKEVIFREIDLDLGVIHEHVTWAQLKDFIDDAKQEWLDLQNISEKDFERLSEICKIPALHFQSRLSEDGFPRIDNLDNAALIFLYSSQSHYPAQGNKYFTIVNTGLLVICNKQDIITISEKRTDLFENVLESARKHFKSNPTIVLVLYEIFDFILKKHKVIIADIEMLLLRMERVLKPQNPSAFLERAFQLKKELTRIVSIMFHLREVITLIVSRRVPFAGFDQSSKALFDILQDEVTYLHETAESLKENLLSIIDLHINRTSYETNKVMRFFAVLTALAIIPTMVSGLLGENLLDVPFNAYLWQVLALTLIGMALVLYIFIKLGWLKS
jgi:Mg2+ and Co2+ transporter CorA